MPYFWVASTAGSAPIGVATFTEDAGGATSALLSKLPASFEPQHIGLFPCFTRGVNLYKAEDVETAEIAAVLPAPSPRVYGMFAHGELGPSGGWSGFAREPTGGAAALAHEQHSMTSILAVHTSEMGGAKVEL